MATNSKSVTDRNPDSSSRSGTANYSLWAIQTLLALVFLFAGSMKLILPMEAMTKQIHLPGLFLRFIGVSEILGAIGLVLPGILGIRRELTPLAAAGLAIITAGATTLTLASGSVGGAIPPFVVCILSLAVAYGRRAYGKVSKSVATSVDLDKSRSTID